MEHPKIDVQYFRVVDEVLGKPDKQGVTGVRLKNVKGNPSYLLDGITSIDTPDDKTVVVTLKNSDPAFLAEADEPPADEATPESAAAGV